MGYPFSGVKKIIYKMIWGNRSYFGKYWMFDYPLSLRSRTELFLSLKAKQFLTCKIVRICLTQALKRSKLTFSPYLYWTQLLNHFNFTMKTNPQSIFLTGRVHHGLQLVFPAISCLCHLQCYQVRSCRS